jgi:glycogen synthase
LQLSADQQRETQALPNLEVFESSYRLEWMQDPWEDVQRSGEWLLKLEKRLRPDIIHLNSYSHGKLPWKAPTVMVAHSCVLSWWRSVLGTDCGSSWNQYKTAVARGIRASKLLVAPSNAMLLSLYEHYGPVPAGKVIANGRSASLFNPRSKKPFILSAGRLWDKSKNVEILDQVAPGVSWPIMVAGDQKPPDGQCDVGCRRVKLMGKLSPERLSGLYSQAAIYVSPVKYEPFGLSILEAGLSGCVLVLGNIGSLREIWGNAAIFVGPDNPGELERVLNELIQSPLLRRIMAGRSRKRALQYSIQRMTGAYMKAYESLLDCDPRRFAGRRDCLARIVT